MAQGVPPCRTVPVGPMFVQILVLGRLFVESGFGRTSEPPLLGSDGDGGTEYRLNPSSIRRSRPKRKRPPLHVRTLGQFPRPLGHSSVGRSRAFPLMAPRCTEVWLANRDNGGGDRSSGGGRKYYKVGSGYDPPCWTPSPFCRPLSGGYPVESAT